MLSMPSNIADRPETSTESEPAGRKRKPSIKATEISSPQSSEQSSDCEAPSRSPRRAERRAGARRPAPKNKASTSRFRGVTLHCRTKRWEAHIWEKKQIYLGGFDTEEQAALAFDIAAVKYRGAAAKTNFHISNYEEELANLDQVSTEDVIRSLRQQSRGAQTFSSQYRGVTKHQKGKWEARIGTMLEKKYKYLGLYENEIDAAKAYDMEAIKRRGVGAVTNFDLSTYLELLSEEDIADAQAKQLLPADFNPTGAAVLAEKVETSQEETLVPWAPQMEEWGAVQRPGWALAPTAPQQSTMELGPKLDKMPNGPLWTAGPSGEQTPRSIFEIPAHIPETPRAGGSSLETELNNFDANLDGIFSNISLEDWSKMFYNGDVPQAFGSDLEGQISLGAETTVAKMDELEQPHLEGSAPKKSRTITEAEAEEALFLAAQPSSSSHQT